MAKGGANYTDDRFWQSVAKTLPASANAARVRAELERIGRDKLSSEEMVNSLEASARQDELWIRSSPVTTEEQTQLQEHAHWCRQQAKHYDRMKGQPAKLRRQYAILLLWQECCGDPPITDRIEEPAIQYFQAATTMVFGKPISAGRAKKVIQRFRHMRFSRSQYAGVGSMLIDDSLVTLIRADGAVER